MATFTNPSDLDRLFEEAAKSERRRKADADAQTRAIAGSAIESVSSLLDLFARVPRAMIAARRAEYDRVVQRYGDAAHPRAREVEASLARLDQFNARADAGRARASLALDLLKTPDNVFAGFVADAEGQPLAGMTVQLAGERVSARSHAVTAKDGRFRIRLPAADSAAGVVSVRVLDARGTLVFEDPVELQIGSGSAYREYRISGRSDVPRDNAAVRQPRTRPVARKRSKAKTGRSG